MKDHATEGMFVIYTGLTVFTFGLFLVSLIKFNDMALVLSSQVFIPWGLVTATLVAATYFAGKAAFYLLTFHLANIHASLLGKK